jgi:hypothetical protein
LHQSLSTTSTVVPITLSRRSSSPTAAFTATTNVAVANEQTIPQNKQSTQLSPASPTTRQYKATAIAQQLASLEGDLANTPPTSQNNNNSKSSLQQHQQISFLDNIDSMPPPTPDSPQTEPTPRKRRRKREDPQSCFTTSEVKFIHY